MTLNPGRYHLGVGPIIVCSNYDPRLSLTYLMAKSNKVYAYFHKTFEPMLSASVGDKKLVYGKYLQASFSPRLHVERP